MGRVSLSPCRVSPVALSVALSARVCRRVCVCCGGSVAGARLGAGRVTAGQTVEQVFDLRPSNKCFEQVFEKKSGGFSGHFSEFV